LIKKLLNKLIFITIIFNLLTYNSFAEWSCESGCKIKSWTPEVVLEYISNNKKIISNLSANLWKGSTEYNIPTNINVWWNSKSILDLEKKDKPWYINENNSFSTWIWLRIYNSLFNWKETESWFKYFLSNIDWDVPTPISRDLRLIDNQNQTLNYFLSRVIKWWHSSNDIDVKKACEWVEDNWKCEKLLGNNIEEAIKNLINNNSTINLILRKELWFMWFNSIVWSDSYDELFAISENFKSEIQSNYNKETYKSCANCKWWSVERIKKSIKKISLNDKDWKKWMDEWENAWNLLLWIKDDENKKNDKSERNLLTQELAKQWVSSSNWSAVLNDLKENQWKTFWMSIWNNPITNSFENFIDAISTPFKSKKITILSETVGNLFWEGKETISINEITAEKKVIVDDTDISKKIKNIVKQNQAIISKQNKSTDKLQWRIIQLHINLSQTINTIEKIIPKTEKICNDQDSGNGKCNYRR
jgi:hypothetical protein